MESLVPIVAIIMGLSIPLFSMYLNFRRREVFHRERLAALEKGITLPEPVEETRVKNPSRYLLHGLVWLFIGAGIAGFFYGISVSQASGDDFPTGIALMGAIPGGVGLAQLLYYFLKGGELRQDYERALERKNGQP